MSASGNPVIDHLNLWSSIYVKKASAGRGRNGKVSPYGIQKLRELILELAVRGKLVPQDPNDESASVLLDRMADEKSRLVKNEKIKKQKLFAPITEVEKPFLLPQGWEWCRLGNIGFTQTGGTPKKANAHHYGNFIPFLKPGDILDGEIISYNQDGLSEEGAESLGRIAPVDSILMVCIGTIGKCARVDREVSFNQQINSVSPYAEIGKYVATCLQSPIFQKAAWFASASTTIAILNKGKWGNIPIAIAPEKEQHLIVAKVDELMALCDQLEQQQTDGLQAHQTLVETLLGTLTSVESPQKLSEAWNRISDHFDTLFNTEPSIDRLKQTILKLAVMGKLVPQDPNDETASVLLGKISKEKVRLIKEGKIKKQRPLPELTEDEKEFELPHSWAWCRFQDITKLITDGKHGDCNNFPDSGYYFLSAKDIQNGELIYDNARQIVPEEFEEVHQRTDLQPGDICMVNTGATVGKMAIAADHEFTYRTTFQKSVAVIKIVPPFIDLHYVSNYLQSEAPRLLKKSGGSAINNLLLGDLKKKSVPLPPINEQVAIVAKVDELMVLCDALKARLVDTQAIRVHLANAVVERAIR